MCPPLSLTRDTSVVIISGDRTLTAECDTGPGDHARHKHTLLLSCTDTLHHNATISGNDKYIMIIFSSGTSHCVSSGLDCVNGTMMSRHTLTSNTWDWTSLRKHLITENNKPPSKRQNLAVAPHTSELIIFDKTKVMLSEKINDIKYLQMRL